MKPGHSRPLLAPAALAMPTMMSSSTAPGAPPSARYTNGKIAFTSQGDIWTVNPDASGLLQITNNPEWETEARCSPGGDYLALPDPSGAAASWQPVPIP